MFETLTDALSGAVQSVKNTVKNIFGGNEPVYDDDLVGFVEREYKRRVEERRPFELQWRLNQCFYEGNQYIDINTASWSLEEQPILYDWQEREVFNHIAPNIETRISKLKRVRSILKCSPGTSEQADLHSAKVGTMLLKQNYNDQGLRDKQAEELTWMEICGTVFRKHIWNPNAGKVIAQEEVTDPATGEVTVQDIHEGAEEVITFPPHEGYPDSSYRNDLTGCKSFIHARAYDVADIMDEWGVDVRPESAEAEKLQRAMTGFGGLGYGQGGFTVGTVKLENHAIVKEYMELPSKAYPSGRLIIVAGGKKLYAGPLPYKVGEKGKAGLPISMLICLKRPGIIWGKTVLERLIPIQRRYNALRNRKAEHLNRTAIGQWDVEDNSVDLDIFEQEASAPGAIHVYKKGFSPPKPVQHPSLPADFDKEEATLLNEFAILSGVGELSRQSSAPAGVKSGVALSIIQEQDDTRLSNTVENIERFNIHSGKIQLRLFKQFVAAPRTLHAVGKNNVADVIDWMGSDITSDDIILDNMQALAESPAQKRQMVFDLLESGLLFDPQTGRLNNEMRSKVFEMIEMGEWESADDEDQLHIAKAERENRAMFQGMPAMAVDYDDAITHISRHNKFRLTTDYEEAVAQNPMLEVLFNQHVNMHLMAMAKAMQAQMAAQQSPEGQDKGDKPAA